MTPTELFQKIIGNWEGTCKTWFEPGKLADESDVKGTFTPVLEGRFLRHTYEGTLKGRSRHGEELLAQNAVTKEIQCSWVDDFHMSTAIMFSVGQPTDTGFDIRGGYDVGEGHPPWGWRTVYQLVDDNHLTITAYNVSPEGEEDKAVETTYQRC